MHLGRIIWLLICTASLTKSSPPLSEHNFKTKLCSTYLTTGRCRYDEKCHFAHGRDELKEKRDSNIVLAFEKKMKEYEGRIDELEFDLDRAWQHITRIEQDLNRAVQSAIIELSPR